MAEDTPPAATTFTDLALSPELVKALAKQGATEPTPIQALAIPHLLKGEHGVLSAETGTGKTLAYLLPIFTQLDLGLRATQAIVLAPTHELAIQIHRQCTDLSQHGNIPMRALLLIGGSPIDRQLIKLRFKPHIVVGSPGRIEDLIRMGKLKANSVRTVVVDEADRLLVGETRGTIKSIMRATPKKTQHVYASATQQGEALEYMQAVSPGFTTLKPSEDAVNTDITHAFVVCEPRDRIPVLRKMLNAMQPERALVFAQDNALAERAALQLDHHGIAVAELSADFEKMDRKQAMDDFRSGRVQVLLASDMAARGLDFPGVTHVFNLDAPMQPRAYLHRSGRTGRAGQKGVCITMVTPDTERLIKRYEKDLGITLVQVDVREGKVYEVR
ncbi:MAG: DEAD/DEAH box helicase [Candidatus Eisenbacteria bacterium]|nr:DEAD/DEAH box helicase [Candidatus Eisenbacteria bacterium]